ASFDTGHTWIEAPALALLPGWAGVSDPAVEWDNQGNNYVGLPFPPAGSPSETLGIAVYKSSDGGAPGARRTLSTRAREMTSSGPLATPLLQARTTAASTRSGMTPRTSLSPAPRITARPGGASVTCQLARHWPLTPSRPKSRWPRTVRSISSGLRAP